MHFPDLLTFCQRLLFFLPFTTTAHNSIASAQEFSYANSREWHVDYPQCGGRSQSPIIINPGNAVQIVTPPITFGSYDKHFSKLILLQNNGHTIKFSVPKTVEGITPFIANGPLQGTYEAAEVHFHWGSPFSKGSEHQINRKRYDMEMHIVHKNTKYANVSEAQGYPDGLSVIGVFLKVEKILDILPSGLNTVINAIPFVLLYNTTAYAGPLKSLGSLLENMNRDNFYTYQGSLTTPPCSEAVTWIVYPEPLPISALHLKIFWLVLDEHFGKLWNNFRPVQTIGDRNVYHRSQ